MRETGINLLRLGLNIRRWRHGRRMTQAQLGKKIGCASQTISAMERGKQNVSVEALFRLSRALGCPVKELLLGVE